MKFYIVKRHPQPTPNRRWACVDTRDDSVVSEHRRKSLAQDTAAFANSIEAKYGSIR